MNCKDFRAAWKGQRDGQDLHVHFDQCPVCQLWVDAALLDDLGGNLRPDAFTERRIREAVRAAARVPNRTRRIWWGAGIAAASLAAAWLVFLRPAAIVPETPAAEEVAINDADVSDVLVDQFTEDAEGPDALLAMVDVHPEYAEGESESMDGTVAEPEAAIGYESENDETSGWYFADLL